MIKIRYAELPAGLHVTAEGDRSGTVVYLLPGLTPAQRRAALMRVRSSARMGQGPSLPAPAMAVAIAADRVRTTARTCAAAMRGHPVLFLPPLIAIVVSAIVFMLMSQVPLTVPPQDRAVGLAAHAPRRQLDVQSPHRHHHHHRITSARRLGSPVCRAHTGSSNPVAGHLPTPRDTGERPLGHRGRTGRYRHRLAVHRPPSPSPSPSPAPSPSSSCIRLGPAGSCLTT